MAGGSRRVCRASTTVPASQLAGMLAAVKTTFDLPAELVRSVKLRALQQDRKLKDVVAELLRRALAEPLEIKDQSGRRRVELPLVRCAHPAAPDQTLTPDRVAAILEEQEAQDLAR